MRAHPCAALAIVAFAVIPAAAADPREITADQAAAFAVDNNPEIVRLRGEVEAARARVEGASALFQDNPELGVGAGPRSGANGTSLDLRLQVDQRLELFGQRGRRSEAASEALRAAESELEAGRRSIAADARAAFGRALAARERVALAQEGMELARQAFEASQARFTAGAATKIDVGTSNVESSRAARERALANQQLALALAELGLLLALPPGDQVVPAGKLEVPPAGETPDADVFATLAQQRRPEIAATRARLASAVAEEELASRLALPGVSVGASYGREDGGTHIVMANLGLTVPVFNANREGRGTATARVGQARAAFEAMTRTVGQEARVAVSRVVAARDAAQAYEGGVLASLQENLSLATEAYRAGKLDFIQLLVVRRETLEARRGFIDAQEELFIARALLERATGNGP